MTDHTNPEAKSRAADALIRIFEEQISTGLLRDGDPLPPEREIVQTHGVSRTVVREAVLALSAKGLVDARPRFRPVVRAPSYETVFDTVDSVASRLVGQPGGVKNLFDLRIIMEASLARTAAVDADRDHITALKAALAANKAAIENSQEFFRTDIAFHAVLYDIPRNPILPAIHRAYTDWLSGHWSLMPRAPERNQLNYEAHAAILDAILARDPDLAEAALRTHLARAWDQVKRTFDDV